MRSIVRIRILLPHIVIEVYPFVVDQIIALLLLLIRRPIFLPSALLFVLVMLLTI